MTDLPRDWEIEIRPEHPSVKLDLHVSYRLMRMVNKLAKDAGCTPGLWMRNALLDAIRHAKA